MKLAVLLVLVFMLPLPVFASHAWSSFDICEAYKDKLPPGLTAAALPDAQSAGAALLNRYCTQCHNLPGPDRHTAAEWHQVVAKMFMLMDISHRFGGLTGKVEVMQTSEQEMLSAYLEKHASVAFVSKESQNSSSWTSRIFALLPFLLLTGLGLLRWKVKSKSKIHPDEKSCITD
jgi:cytochrome c5